MTELTATISALAHQNTVVLAELTETCDRETYVELCNTLQAQISKLEDLTIANLDAISDKIRNEVLMKSLQAQGRLLKLVELYSLDTPTTKQNVPKKHSVAKIATNIVIFDLVNQN